MSRLMQYFREKVREGEVSHAYLLEVPGAENQRKLGLDLASLILCEQHSGCGSCDTCRAVLSGNHPDVITVTHEKPNVISVGEIRAQLVEDMGIRPFRAEKKIYLVPEAELMNPQAQNALLKTLEEPPLYGMIFLFTSNRSSFLPTVLSRTVYLSEEEDGEGEGGQNAGRGKLFEYLHRAASMSGSEAAGLFTALKEAGMDRADIYERLNAWWRDLLVFKSGADSFRFPEEEDYYDRYSRRLSDAQLEKLWQAIQRARFRTDFNVNPDLALELFFLELGEELRKSE